MNDLTGQSLGQYRIVEPIGRGGMASVYKAYQPSLDRYVAVKVLPPYYAHEPGFAMRFTREAKAVAKLDHPHILPIYDFGQEGDVSYIVMKYVAAGTLKEMLDRPIPLAQAVEIVRQIAAALDHAHEQGVIHRDVKPSNVLMDRGQWALLMDFGLAKMVAGSVQLTASGVGVGTPAYMAPEQGQGVAVDRRSDVYSLGIVLYEMLTGRVPFDAETPLAVVLKHITDPLPLPRTVNPAIPESVERVILKALSKAPDGRYATTREMADALQRALVEAGSAPEAALSPAEAALVPPEVARPMPEEPPVPGVADIAEAVEAVEGPSRRKLPWWAFAGGAVAAVALMGVILAAMGVFSHGEEQVPTPVPVAAYVTEGTLGAVLFEDDFEGRPSSRWQFLPQTWQSETLDGRTFLHNAPTTEDFSSAELRDTSWSDYAVQFDFRFLQPDRFGGHYFYIRTRLANCPPTVRALEGYVVLLSPDVVRLEKETCATQRRDTLAESDRDLAVDEWHTVQLVVIGHRIRVLVEGQEQIDFVDREAPLLGGDVIVETENNVEFLLDDFIVYEVIPEEGGVAIAPAPTPAPILTKPEGGKIVERCAGVRPPQLCVRDAKTRASVKITELDFEVINAPAWSPDGQQIVFAAGSESGDAGPHDHKLYVVTADGSDLRQITHGDTMDDQPDWSPDGEWIAFMRNGELWLVHPDGSDGHVLLERTYNREAWMPKWSPDGQAFAFFNFSPSVLPEIWVVNRDGSDPRLVYGFEHPLEDWAGWGWSPDGRQIAAEYQVDGRWGCLIARADGSGEAQRTDEGCPAPWCPAFWPRWGGGEAIAALGPTVTPLPIESIAPGGPAPDTRDIRPCAWGGLGPGLCIFSWEGGDPVRLFEDAELEFTLAPSWSPDGGRIAFSAREPDAEPDRPNDIFMANADGTGLQALPSDRNDLGPAWSPDGEWLAFHSNCDLALMHPDGSAFSVIWPHDDRCTMMPQWSPDGEWIAVSLVPAEEWVLPMTREVWVLSRNGDRVTPVAEMTHESEECVDGTVAFSPDSGQVAYLAADCRPMVANADGTGQAVPLADFPYWWGSFAHPQWGGSRP